MNDLFSKYKMSELIEQLDSNNKEAAEKAKQKITELLSTVKDSWLVNGLFDYYLKTNSVKTMEILVKVPDHHHSYLFDKCSDLIRNRGLDIKVQVLTLLGHVVRNQPTWLYNIKDHQLLKDILRILKNEVEYLPLITALLIIVTLMPIIPSHIGDFLDDIFDIFSRLASWQYTSGKSAEEQLLHLQMSFYALFLRLYGMYPCNFVAYLRTQYKDKNRPVFGHTIKPMLHTVKMNPSIITSSKDTEVSMERWKTMSVHDVIVECESFALDPNEKCIHELRISTNPRSKLEHQIPLDFLSTPRTLLKLDNLDFFSGTSILRGDSPARIIDSSPSIMTKIPATIIPTAPQAELEVIDGQSCHSQGSSPPETAIEATPDPTPIRLPGEVRADSLSKPKMMISSPLRIIQSDAANISRATNSPKCQEDDEVVCIMSDPSSSQQLISRQCDSVLHDNDGVDCNESIYDDPEHGSPCSAGGLHMPNLTDCARKVQRLRYHSQCNTEQEEESSGSSPGTCMAFPDSGAVRRASSCPEIKKAQLLDENNEDSANVASSTNRVHKEKTFANSETQTENFWPMPYEHLFLGMFPRLESQESIKASPLHSPIIHAAQSRSSQPSVYELLEKYIETVADGEKDSTKYKDKVQLQLLYQQLLFEKHRRETHASRNRRLFPEVRNTRHLEEANSALMDQVQLKQTDIDQFKKEIAILTKCKIVSDDKCKTLENIEKQQCLLQDKVQQLNEQIIKLELHLKESESKYLEFVAHKRQVEETLNNVLTETKVTRKQAAVAERYKAQVTKLNRDLFMAGELVLKFQQKLENEAKKQNYENEYKQLRQVYNGQMRSIGPQLEQKTQQLEIVRARINDLEQKLSRYEQNVKHTKRTLNDANITHEQKLKAVNDKYKTQGKINEALSHKILELYATIEKHEVTSPDLSSCQEVDLSSLSASVKSTEQGSRLQDVQDFFSAKDVMDQMLPMDSEKPQLEEEIPAPARTVMFQDSPQQPGTSQSSSLQTQKPKGKSTLKQTSAKTSK